MEVEKNEGDGKSVFLTAGDRLTKVPRSHRDLVTPRIREVFADPPAHFLQVAKSCPFPPMAKWVKALVADGTWMLGLHRGDPPTWTQAGFEWLSDKVRSAEIGPSTGEKVMTTVRSGRGPAVRSAPVGRNITIRASHSQTPDSGPPRAACTPT
jgi:hypothetical protein